MTTTNIMLDISPLKFCNLHEFLILGCYSVLTFTIISFPQFLIGFYNIVEEDWSIYGIVSNISLNK